MFDKIRDKYGNRVFSVISCSGSITAVAFNNEGHAYYHKDDSYEILVEYDLDGNEIKREEKLIIDLR